MSALATPTPAGTPSRIATRAGPCDSPAVSQRSTVHSLSRVRRGDLLGYAHPPRLDDQLTHLGLIDRVEPHLKPVVSLVRARRRQELLRLGRQHRSPLFLREAETHDGPVAGERQIDDPAH